ncbi:unnamed protein product, partial [Polarella glacialis]
PETHLAEICKPVADLCVFWDATLRASMGLVAELLEKAAFRLEHELPTTPEKSFHFPQQLHSKELPSASLELQPYTTTYGRPSPKVSVSPSLVPLLVLPGCPPPADHQAPDPPTEPALSMRSGGLNFDEGLELARELALQMRDNRPKYHRVFSEEDMGEANSLQQGSSRRSHRSVTIRKSQTDGSESFSFRRFPGHSSEADIEISQSLAEPVFRASQQ